MDYIHEYHAGPTPRFEFHNARMHDLTPGRLRDAQNYFIIMHSGEKRFNNRGKAGLRFNVKEGTHSPRIEFSLAQKGNLLSAKEKSVAFTAASAGVAFSLGVARANPSILEHKGDPEEPLHSGKRVLAAIEKESDLLGVRAVKLYAFLKNKGVPFVKKHGSAYFKNAYGSQGTSMTRFTVRNGILFMQTSNAAFEAVAREYARVLNRKMPEMGGTLEGGIPLGKIDSLSNKDLAFAAGMMVSTHPSVYDSNDPWILEKEIPHLKINGAPLEFRFLLQKKGKAYSTVAHYAKVGMTAFASNISQGGEREASKAALMVALMQSYPKQKRARLEKKADAFLQAAAARAEDIFRKNGFDHSVRVDHDPTQLITNGKNIAIPKNAQTYRIITSPTSLNVDIVAQEQKGKLVPVVMEKHYGGIIGFTGTLLDEKIMSKREVEQIRIQHWKNLNAILSETRKKILRNDFGLMGGFMTIEQMRHFGMLE